MSDEWVRSRAPGHPLVLRVDAGGDRWQKTPPCPRDVRVPSRREPLGGLTMHERRELAADILSRGILRALSRSTGWAREGTDDRPDGPLPGGE